MQSPRITNDSRDKNKTTHVVFIIDKSTSMNGKEEFVVDSFNEQLNSLKAGTKENMETLVSLVQFGTTVESPTFHKRDINCIENLAVKDYVPNGMTALNDAIGTTVKPLFTFNDKNTAYLVVIITDGAENYSKKWTNNETAELITDCKNKGNWTFVYMGTNQDLSLVQDQLNLSAANTFSFVDTQKGWKGASFANSAGVQTYMSNRSMGTMSTDKFYSEPDKEESKSE